MKGILIALAIVLWLAGCYFAFIYMVGKSMRPSQTDKENSAPTYMQQDQSQKVQSLADQQRRLLEDRQRRMRNH